MGIHCLLWVFVVVSHWHVFMSIFETLKNYFFSLTWLRSKNDLKAYNSFCGSKNAGIILLRAHIETIKKWLRTMFPHSTIGHANLSLLINLAINMLRLRFHDELR